MRMGVMLAISLCNVMGGGDLLSGLYILTEDGQNLLAEDGSVLELES